MITQIPDHGSRLLHQLDSSRGIGEDHINKYFEILQEKHPRKRHNLASRHNRKTVPSSQIGISKTSWKT